MANSHQAKVLPFGTQSWFFARCASLLGLTPPTASVNNSELISMRNETISSVKEELIKCLREIMGHPSGPRILHDAIILLSDMAKNSNIADFWLTQYEAKRGGFQVLPHLELTDFISIIVAKKHPIDFNISYVTEPVLLDTDRNPKALLHSACSQKDGWIMNPPKAFRRVRDSIVATAFDKMMNLLEQGVLVTHQSGVRLFFYAPQPTLPEYEYLKSCCLSNHQKTFMAEIMRGRVMCLVVQPGDLLIHR